MDHSPFFGYWRDERTDAIFAGALEVWGHWGYMGATMREISAASGQSMGSIYHRFKSKEVLFRNVAADCARHYDRAMMRVIPDRDDREIEPRVVVEALVHRHVEWAAAQPAAARFMAALPEHEIARLIDKRRLNESIDAWARAEIALGRLRVVPPELVRPLVLGATQIHVAELLTADEGLSISEVAPPLAAAAWAVLRPPRRPGRRRSRRRRPAAAPR